MYIPLKNYEYNTHGDFKKGHVRRFYTNKQKGDAMKKFMTANFRQGNVQNVRNTEEFYYPLFDRTNYPTTGVSQISFFSIPRGQSASLIVNGAVTTVSKSDRDTNLDTPNQINISARTVDGISLNFIPMTLTPTSAVTNNVAADIQNILNGGFIRFKVGQKTVLESPLPNIPAYASVVGASATSTTVAATTNTVVALGNRGMSGMYEMRTPLTLNPNAPFTVVVSWVGLVTVAQPYDLLLQLHGTLRQPT